jgi:hypothetical protein
MNQNNRDIRNPLNLVLDGPRIPGIRTWVEIFEAIQKEHEKAGDDRQVSVPSHAVVAITDEDVV